MDPGGEALGASAPQILRFIYTCKYCVKILLVMTGNTIIMVILGLN